MLRRERPRGTGQRDWNSLVYLPVPHYLRSGQLQRGEALVMMRYAHYAAALVVRRWELRINEYGRGDWIRTSDLLNPIQVRYQAALRPAEQNLVYHARCFRQPSAC